PRLLSRDGVVFLFSTPGRFGDQVPRRRAYDPSVYRAPDHVNCTLCERSVPKRLITLHHLKPRQKGGKAEHRTPLCKPCHKQLHATFSNTDLAQLYDSI